jgi:opacity protein-like surface antigen
MRATVPIVSFALFMTAALECHAQYTQYSQHGQYEPRPTGFYVKGGIGPSFLQDTDLKSFPGSSVDREVQFDIGIRFDIGGGYQVTPWFAAEFETGFINNSIDSIQGAAEEDAWVINIPFMLNAVFQCPHLGRFVPYIGIGLGFSSSIIDVDEITIGSTTVFGGSESDVVFAAHGFAGFRYHIDDHWSVGAEYKYLATDEPSWEVDSVTFGGPSERIKLDTLRTHSVTVGFRYSF